MPNRIARAAYAGMYGPTTGDRLRLADTDLIVEVERDLTVYGEEVKFGGGKVIRDGMGQSQASRAEGAVDTVITNALIVDWTGVYKADVGLKDGRIAAIGKAGNPDTQPAVTIVVGPGTEVIAGEGAISASQSSSRGGRAQSPPTIDIQKVSRLARAPSRPPATMPDLSAAAFIAPAEVPLIPSISIASSSRMRSSAPQVKAPCAPPPWSARLTTFFVRLAGALKAPSSRRPPKSSCR